MSVLKDLAYHTLIFLAVLDLAQSPFLQERGPGWLNSTHRGTEGKDTVLAKALSRKEGWVTVQAWNTALVHAEPRRSRRDKEKTRDRTSREGR